MHFTGRLPLRAGGAAFRTACVWLPVRLCQSYRCTARNWQRPIAAVDRIDMNLNELDQLRRHPEWQQVLRAYRTEQRVQKKIQPEEEEWVRRLHTISGVAETHLPRIHGKLMAYGLLKFRLAGRADGVLYRVSSAGLEALRILEERQSSERATVVPPAQRAELPGDAA